jgi:hypothetical protein
LIDLTRLSKIVGNVDEVTHPERQIDAIQHNPNFDSSEIKNGTVEDINITEIFSQFQFGRFVAELETESSMTMFLCLDFP